MLTLLKVSNKVKHISTSASGGLLANFSKTNSFCQTFLTFLVSLHNAC